MATIEREQDGMNGPVIGIVYPEHVGTRWCDCLELALLLIMRQSVLERRRQRLPRLSCGTRTASDSAGYYDCDPRRVNAERTADSAMTYQVSGVK
jgi:hypothetical protein